MSTCEALNNLRQKIKSGHVKVDVEYDKALDEEKINDGKPSRPDLLIHHRGNNLDNYAFIELKKSYRTKRDIEKCEGAKKSPYDYKNVLIIDLLEKSPCEMRIIEILAAGGEPNRHPYPSNDDRENTGRSHQR
ncbi:hypothetical protein ACTRXD_11635 [Nitrospira sp. T9]|uniref:hypothetical protein n=1 Tax=unclassified Nitrospira TaxID=2652172 RepID=UPI003F99BFF0